MSAAVADPVVEGPIRVDDVVLTRGDRTILDHVSALIPAGKATAVVGPSGAGKSTLLAVAAGFEPVDAGSVDNPFPRSATGVVLQAYGLIRLLTAAENVELALQSTGMPADRIRERAAHQLERFGLAALADRRTDELSGGQQQRLAIARALVIEPRLVIADELTSELDPRNRDRILAEILGMREQGVTILLATHDGGVADRCDHVVRVGTAVDSAAEQRTRGAAAEAAIAEQRRRIAAQQQIVDREAARLADLQRALERLLDQRGR